MSDSDSGEIKTTNNKSALDDELDYEEDEENEKKLVANREKTAVKESDGEIDDDDDEEEEKRDRKSHYRRKEEKEEGEEEEEGEESGEDRSDDEGGRKRGEREKFAKRNDDDVVKEKKEKEEVLSEEEGEINDGERVKKAFIPRVLCKYYQRGKCSWGRGCKFLHPGVNDTGNYSFLEFQDPNAKVFQQAQAQQQQQQQQQTHVDPDSQDQTAASDGATVKSGAGAQPASMHTESAWERGLRHAKEMKERAMRRKQMEKDQFDDKKMNLSLKDFENEKENDERYINAERPANADEDQEDEEILMYAASSRLNRPGNQDTTSGFQRDHDERNIPYSTGYNRQSNYRQPYDSSDRSRGDNSAQSRSKPGPSTSRGGPEQRRPASPPQRGGKSRADEWHDPWDKSRLAKKPSGGGNQRRSGGTAAEPSYSSSESDSRSGSRSRSRSRSSYSSKSSYSSRSSSYSDRSNSPAQRGRGQKRGQDAKAAVGRSSQNQKATKSVVSAAGAGGSSKALPGRGVPDLTLKKANIAGVKKRSRSNSSASSYSSSASASSDEDGSKDASEESTSESESDSDANEDEDLRKPSKKTVKSSTGIKRSAAKDSKTASNVKKPKVSNSPPRSKDKKQLIKDQLKLLESALKKKAMSK